MFGALQEDKLSKIPFPPLLSGQLFLKKQKITQNGANLPGLDDSYIRSASKALTLGGITLEYGKNLTFL